MIESIMLFLYILLWLVVSCIYAAIAAYFYIDRVLLPPLLQQPIPQQPLALYVPIQYPVALPPPIQPLCFMQN